jgi:DNA-binding protein HU-beta
MNKGELVTAIAKETGVTKKDIEAVIKGLTATVTGELKAGGKVQIPELGSFKVTDRAAREVRNPQTGEKIKAPACKAVKFTTAKALKTAVNEKKAAKKTKKK